MGRKWKPGVDYFKVNTSESVAVKMIEAKYGLIGYALLMKLKQHIFKNQGYFLEWDEDNKLMFLIEHNLTNTIEISFLDEFVSECVKRGVFSEYVFENFNILTSLEIQEEYFFITQKRCYREIRDEIMLISDEEVKVLNALNEGVAKKQAPNEQKGAKVCNLSPKSENAQNGTQNLAKQAKNILARVLNKTKAENAEPVKECKESNKYSNKEMIDKPNIECSVNRHVSLMSETIPIEYISISKDIDINHGGKKPHFDNPDVDKAFREFLQFRKTLNKPIYKSFVHMVIAQVKKLSGDNPEMAIKILRQSIIQGWSGLYPLDHGIGKGQKPLKVKTFQNFEQRRDDIDSLALEKLRKRIKKE